MTEEIQEKVDGRMNEGKVQAKLETRLKKIEKMLADHEKRIAECSIRR